MPGFNEMSKHDSSFDSEARRSKLSIIESMNQKRMQKKLNEDYKKLVLLYQQCHAERHPLQLKLAKATNESKKYGLTRLTDGVDTLCIQSHLLNNFMNTYNKDGSVNFYPYSLRIKNYILVQDYYLNLIAYRDIGENMYGKVIKKSVKHYGKECEFENLTSIKETLTRYGKCL